MIGIASFKEYFKGFEDQYVIIGGTACELLMSDNSLNFRATNDIDMVLIIETLTKEFCEIFWQYINDAGYEHISKATNKSEYYRFSNPKSPDYPKMIELFSRKQDWLLSSIKYNIIPIHIDDEVSSLSAILLDNTYYNFLTEGISKIDDISILNAEHIIPFKAKAWIDLTYRKEHGELIDSKDIKKHRNDIIRLSTLLSPNLNMTLPNKIKEDLSFFIQKINEEEFNLNQLGINHISKEELIQFLNQFYNL